MISIIEFKDKLENTDCLEGNNHSHMINTTIDLNYYIIDN